jgi:hypothetical protein
MKLNRKNVEPIQELPMREEDTQPGVAAKKPSVSFTPGKEP